jgi:hypothetical protein
MRGAVCQSHPQMTEPLVDLEQDETTGQGHSQARSCRDITSLIGSKEKVQLTGAKVAGVKRAASSFSKSLVAFTARRRASTCPGSSPLYRQQSWCSGIVEGRIKVRFRVRLDQGSIKSRLRFKFDQVSIQIRSRFDRGASRSIC